MKSLLHAGLAYLVILIILLANPLIFFRYSGRKTELKTRFESCESLKSQITSIRLDIETLTAEVFILENDMPVLRKNIDSLHSMLLTEKDFPQLLKDIQDICRTNQIEITLLEQTGEKELRSSYRKCFFLLKASGSYDNIVRLLGQTESFRYLLVIKDFNIDNIRPENGNLDIRVNLLVFLRESKA